MINHEEAYLSYSWHDFSSDRPCGTPAAGISPDPVSYHWMWFSDASSEAVENVLRKLKEADLGISIVVSGLISEVSEIAKRVGLKPHTATISLGIYGKKSLLPEDDVLKITTMCGHSLIGNNLVRFAQKEIEAGRDPEEVADLLSRPCICGIFNVRRCAALMRNQDG